MVNWQDAIDIVSSQFRYLETDFGFKLISLAPPFIKYESKTIKLNIYYEIDGRGELDLSIEPFEKFDSLINDRREYGIKDLMRVNRDKGHDGYIVPFPGTINELETNVRELSDLLKKYGESVLKGDISDFIRIEDKIKNQIY
jgi:hypothetical protein